jgi:hypothetical protein
MRRNLLSLLTARWATIDAGFERWGIASTESERPGLRMIDDTSQGKAFLRHAVAEMERLYARGGVWGEDCLPTASPRARRAEKW